MKLNRLRDESRLSEALKWCQDRKDGKPLPGIVFPDVPGEPPKRFVAYVYMLKAGDFYKVGVAKDIEKRIADMQTGCPYAIETFFRWPSHEPYKLERLIHHKLRDCRYRGEWFKPTPEIISKLVSDKHLRRHII